MLDETEKNKEIWSKMAGLYASTFMPLDTYNSTYDAFCKAVKTPHAKILELGCGPGIITNYLKTHRPDFYITATDMAPGMIAVAKELTPEVTFLVMDARHLPTLNKKYEGIVCGFCLPYLDETEVKTLLKDSSLHLEADGILYLSMIEGKYANSGDVYSSTGEFSLFVHQYEESFIIDQANFNGLALLEATRFYYSKKNGDKEVHWVGLFKKS